jgi:hypothetical protein
MYLFRFFSTLLPPLSSPTLSLYSAFLPSGLLSSSSAPLHKIPSSGPCATQRHGELLHNLFSSLLSRGSASQGTTVSAHLFHLFCVFLSSCSCSSAAVVFPVQF